MLFSRKLHKQSILSESFPIPKQQYTFRSKFQDQGFKELRTIVERIYYEEERFEDLKPEIQETLRKMPSYYEFIEKLNSYIQEFVEETIEYLEGHLSKHIKLLQREKINHETCIEFHSTVVELVYEEYDVIVTASSEIEKIIQFYHRFNQSFRPDAVFENEAVIVRPLFKRTFYYMLRKDENLKAQLELTFEFLTNAIKNIKTNPEQINSYVPTMDKLIQMHQILTESAEEIRMSEMQNHPDDCLSTEDYPDDEQDTKNYCRTEYRSPNRGPYNYRSNGSSIYDSIPPEQQMWFYQCLSGINTDQEELDRFVRMYISRLDLYSKPKRAVSGLSKAYVKEVESRLEKLLEKPQ